MQLYPLAIYLEGMIAAVDSGTTGTTATLITENGKPLRKIYSELTQYYPRPGWVEHDPEEIYTISLRGLEELSSSAGVSAIGIANQRETTIAWNKKTAQPLHRAIVWQCRRTEKLCQDLKSTESLIREKTGLLLDPYFSATKMKWLLLNVPEVKDALRKGELAFGTVDSWLIYKLTGNHLTDHTNASRTMLYNIHSLDWDEELLELFGIPRETLPEVKPSASSFGEWHGIPLTGVAGDQQSALFGQLGAEPPATKNTYGTGCFLIMNTGEPVQSHHGLLTTLCCGQKGEPLYALEGSVFIAGAVIQWLRDGLGLVESAEETEQLARKVKDPEGVYFVPALVGLGAPYWDAEARGGIFGLSRSTRREHIVASALRSIAFQTLDLIECLRGDTGSSPRELRVDGGASANNYLMQFQADVLGIPVVRPKHIETTALGAGYLAGIGAGQWHYHELLTSWELDRVFIPQISEDERNRLYEHWKEAVRRVLSHP